MAAGHALHTDLTKEDSDPHEQEDREKEKAKGRGRRKPGEEEDGEGAVPGEESKEGREKKARAPGRGRKRSSAAAKSPHSSDEGVSGAEKKDGEKPRETSRGRAGGRRTAGKHGKQEPEAQGHRSRVKKSSSASRAREGDESGAESGDEGGERAAAAAKDEPDDEVADTHAEGHVTEHKPKKSKTEEAKSDDEEDDGEEDHASQGDAGGSESDEDAEEHLPDEVWATKSAVLLLWVAVLAEREGFTFEEGLTYGRAIASLLARAKLRKFGVMRLPRNFGLGLGGMGRANAERRRREGEEIEQVDVFGGKRVFVKNANGLRLAVDPIGRIVSPDEVKDYLRRQFGKHLDEVKEAMERLARAYAKEEIGNVAYSVYEKFRPEVPDDLKGFGSRGRLDLNKLIELATDAEQKGTS